MTNPPLILASSSRYRRELLNRLTLDYTCVSPEVDETVLAQETPLAVCSRLARAKALAVARDYPQAVVIGSDQVCDFEGRTFGKPHTYENAVRQLEMMSGKQLVFHTAVCVAAPGGRLWQTVSDTTVTLRRLSAACIEEYVRREQPYDCAGSAKIEKLGIALMRSVHSDDPTSLIGLPLMQLTGMLAAAGFEILPGIGQE